MNRNSNDLLHSDEVAVDCKIALELVLQQFPYWADLEVRKLNVSGSDNTIFKLGKDKCIRFPRIEEASYHAKKEQKWLPKLAENLALKIPFPIGVGVPSDLYPFYWSVFEWIEGDTAFEINVSDNEGVALELAHFIKSLRKIDVNHDSPISKRGRGLEVQDYEVLEAISKLNDEYDGTVLLKLWRDSLDVPNYLDYPVWMHADLLPSNILIKNNKLASVIDFGLMGVGDPSCDLISAWSIFNKTSRKIFLDELQVDEESYLRGRGWALSIALKVIPYYRKTNQELVTVARRIITEILAE